MIRPDCIRNWRDIQGPDDRHYAHATELMAIDAPFSEALGLTRIGIHHQTLPPGRRTSLPHAESAEEEFVYVLEGTPDLWLNGELHRLAPGDGVGFPPGTGIAHSFLNNSAAPVTLLVVGDKPLPHNKVVYPVDLDMRARREDWWADAPPQALGPHDGVPTQPGER
jgi:uncharacterized cupin superfamily protein